VLELKTLRYLKVLVKLTMLCWFEWHLKTSTSVFGIFLPPWIQQKALKTPSPTWPLLVWQVIGLPRYSEDATRIEAITHKPTVTFEKSLKTVLLESTSFIENWALTPSAAPINMPAILIKVFYLMVVGYRDNWIVSTDLKEQNIGFPPSISNRVLCSGMLLYLHHRNSKLFSHPAKFDNFKDEPLKPFKTVSVSQSKNLLDWKLLV